MREVEIRTKNLTPVSFCRGSRGMGLIEIEGRLRGRPPRSSPLMMEFNAPLSLSGEPDLQKAALAPFYLGWDCRERRGFLNTN